MAGDGRSFSELLSNLFKKSANDATEESIRTLVEQGNEEGKIEATERKMINNVFDFDDVIADEIMTHRTDIVAVEDDAQIEDVIRIALSEGYSRIPVYSEDIDHIVGFIFVKDLLSLLLEQDNTKPKELKDFIRDVMFIPETAKGRDLFTKFLANKEHIAVVVDEYGGTSGIITMEDLIESIVGEIQDEYDREEPEIEKLDDNVYMADGAVDVDKLEDELNIKFVDQNNYEYDSLGGYITQQLGAIPKEDEHPVLDMDVAVFKVELVEDHRIAKVRIELKKKKGEKPIQSES